MKSKAIIVLVYCFLLILSIGILFNFKNKVVVKKRELSWLNSQVKQEENNTAILRSELTYLSMPERIDKLQKKYLRLENNSNAQCRKQKY